MRKHEISFTNVCRGIIAEVSLKNFGEFSRELMVERNSANFVLILSSQYCKKIQVYLTDQVGIGYRLYKGHR